MGWTADDTQTDRKVRELDNETVGPHLILVSLQIHILLKNTTVNMNTGLPCISNVKPINMMNYVWNTCIRAFFYLTFTSHI